MLYLQFNTIEIHDKFLNNFNKFKQLAEQYFLIHAIDTYEVEILFVLNKENLVKINEHLKKKNINLVINSAGIIERLGYNEKIFLYINENNENEFIEILKDYNDKYILYGNIIQNFKILKEILLEIEELNIYDKIFIISKENEEITLISNENKKRNLFKIHEINYYLKKIYDIEYIGFTFYLIKYYNEYILNYLRLVKEEKINSNFIKIKNNQKKKHNIRNNKKLHILNVNNIQEINNFLIFKSKINPNKYFLLNENGSFFNIKNVMLLNRKNIYKIKNKYNRSNEYIYIYTHRNYEYPEINNKKFLIKITKSISNNIKKKIIPCDLNKFLLSVLEQEKKEQENLKNTKLDIKE